MKVSLLFSDTNGNEQIKQVRPVHLSLTGSAGSCAFLICMHTYTYVSVLRDLGRAIYKGKNQNASNSALQGKNCKRVC